MAERTEASSPYGWSRDETRTRQLREGLRMTPAEHLAWLEEMLDELQPHVGSARSGEGPGRSPRR